MRSFDELKEGAETVLCDMHDNLVQMNRALRRCERHNAPVAAAELKEQIALLERDIEMEQNVFQMTFC